jgi:hypothetical protein
VWVSIFFSKGLGLLMEAVPGSQTVGLLVDPANPFHAAPASQLEAAALALNVHGSVRPSASAGEIRNSL